MDVKCVNPNELQCREPFNSLFPPQPQVVLAIAKNMLDHGFDPAFPLVTWNGLIVDGNSRFLAAKKADIDVYHIAHEFVDETAALKFAIRCQRNRRNLSAADVLRCVEELDKRKKTGPKPTDSSATPVAKSGRSSADTATIIGTSRGTVEKARAVLAHAEPEVKAAVHAGTTSINAAYRETVAVRKAPVAEVSQGPQKWSCTLILRVEAETEDAARNAAVTEVKSMPAEKLAAELTCKPLRRNVASSSKPCPLLGRPVVPSTVLPPMNANRLEDDGDWAPSLGVDDFVTSGHASQGKNRR